MDQREYTSEQLALCDAAQRAWWAAGRALQDVERHFSLHGHEHIEFGQRCQIDWPALMNKIVIAQVESQKFNGIADQLAAHDIALHDAMLVQIQKPKSRYEIAQAAFQKAAEEVRRILMSGEPRQARGRKVAA